MVCYPFIQQKKKKICHLQITENVYLRNKLQKKKKKRWKIKMFHQHTKISVIFQRWVKCHHFFGGVLISHLQRGTTADDRFVICKIKLKKKKQKVTVLIR